MSYRLWANRLLLSHLLVALVATALCESFRPQRKRIQIVYGKLAVMLAEVIARWAVAEQQGQSMGVLPTYATGLRVTVCHVLLIPSTVCVQEVLWRRVRVVRSRSDSELIP